MSGIVEESKGGTYTFCFNLRKFFAWFSQSDTLLTIDLDFFSSNDLKHSL